MDGARTYTASEARNNFSDIIESAIHGEPVLVTKRKRTVAVVSVEYLKALTDLEARFDSEKAQQALDEFQKMGGKPLKQFKKELGIL